MTEKVGEQVALAGAMAGVVRARVPEGEVASSKRAKAPQGQGGPRPSGGARANQRKCRSCVGFTDHDSGICRRCRDAATAERVVAHSRSLSPLLRARVL